RTKFFIVADKHRKREYDDKLATSVFASIKPYVRFWDYEGVEKLHSKVAETTLLRKAMFDR
ncbi:MAG: hypothetical protein ACM3MF_05055, partial [Anaerolineae bacterium]